MYGVYLMPEYLEQVTRYHLKKTMNGDITDNNNKKDN